MYAKIFVCANHSMVSILHLGQTLIEAYNTSLNSSCVERFSRKASVYGQLSSHQQGTVQSGAE